MNRLLPFASQITGTGSAYPPTRVTNDDLEKKLQALGVKTNDEWIRERTGISERRISDVSRPEERNSSLAMQAAKQALEMAKKHPNEIDQILFATCSPDTLIPSSACFLQAKLGAERAWAVDLNAACSGFVYALSIADQFISTGQAKTSLIVGSEVMSQFVNWTDRASCVLFGDGAGAAVVERTDPENQNRVLSCHLHSDGKLTDLLDIPAGGSNMEVTEEARSSHLNKMRMKGKEIFKVATKTLAKYAMTALEKNNLSIDELDWFIPHQANMRIIEAVAKRLSFPMDKVIINIDRFGNTSAGTVPTALDEGIRNGKIKRGDTVLMDAFGAGLTYGSALMKW